MNFKKEILFSFREMLVPFRTTKDCHSCRSLLLVWHICSLNWDLDMDSFVGTLCISIGGLVAKYLLLMQEGLSSNPEFYVYYFFIMTSLGAYTQKNFRNACYQVGFCTGFISTGVIQVLKMIRCIA